VIPLKNGLLLGCRRGTSAIRIRDSIVPPSCGRDSTESDRGAGSERRINPNARATVQLFNSLSARLLALVAAEAEELPHAAEEALLLFGRVFGLGVRLGGLRGATLGARFASGAPLGGLRVVRFGICTARFRLFCVTRRRGATLSARFASGAPLGGLCVVRPGIRIARFRVFCIDIVGGFSIASALLAACTALCLALFAPGARFGIDDFFALVSSIVCLDVVIRVIAIGSTASFLAALLLPVLAFLRALGVIPIFVTEFVTWTDVITVGFVSAPGLLRHGHRFSGVGISRRKMTNGQARLARIALGQAA
jgi:hypothetical protein